MRNGDTEFAASPKSPATFSKSSATHSKPQRRPDRDVKLVTHSFVTALLGVTIGALLVILFKPGNKPAACRRFVTEVRLGKHLLVILIIAIASNLSSHQFKVHPPSAAVV